MSRYDCANHPLPRVHLPAALALLLAVGRVSAMEATPIENVPTDYKTIAGNACHVYGTMTYGVPLLKWFSYALNNNDTYPVSVLCPIVRDKALNTDGTASALVNIYNPTAGTSFECSLYSYGKYGNVVASDTDSTTAAGNSTLTLDVNASESLGYYVLLCTLPPVGTYSSKIYSYTYREYHNTGQEGGVSVLDNPATQLP